MRIRSIKPEFWQDPAVSAIDTQLVYAGPVLTNRIDTEAVSPIAHDVRYVYMFFAGDQLLYVGRAWNPWRRIEKHRRQKKWWSRVDYMALVSVTGRTAFECDAHVDVFERLCIHLLTPSENKSRPAIRRGVV